MTMHRTELEGRVLKLCSKALLADEPATSSVIRKFTGGHEVVCLHSLSSEHLSELVEEFASIANVNVH